MAAAIAWRYRVQSSYQRTDPVRSLSARLLLSLLLLLSVFFGVTIVALDFVFRDLADRSMRELLDAQVLALISASDVDPQGLITPPANLLDGRFANPGSGLYAEIRNLSGVVLWRSPSATGTGLVFEKSVTQGKRHYEALRTANGVEVEGLSAGIHWELDRDSAADFVFSVASSREPSRAQLARFRGQLFLWFGGLAGLLLLSVAALMRRVLAPLRMIASEIRDVDAGTIARLSSDYPAELAGVTLGLNALLESERSRLERYRNTLGNLAHGLKTPIAVMKSVLGERQSTDSRDRILDEQVTRMADIVQHQLNRSAAAGGTTLGQTPVAVLPLLHELRGALLRVYSDKDIVIRVACEPALAFQGDRGDLLELIGNIADNACKYCASVVTIEARVIASQPNRISIVVDDDGPGVPDDAHERILERGVRVDESTAGHGLGLSMARDIVAQYRGELHVSKSALGGARFAINLPGLPPK